ncbi:MAG: ISNCY family transposase [Bdellovibrionaceae bacterium]|nr:ISNCY family transposase [Pseudobdellovibrionaceae bacterium]
MGVFVSKREIFKYEQIEGFILRKYTRKEVSLLLDVSERTITRMAGRVRNKGLLGIKHGNTSKRPKNKQSELLESHVKSMIEKHYFDRNITHIQETLRDGHGINLSYSTLRRWCHEINVVKKRRRSKKENDRKKRPRMASEGYLLQMDGSPHCYVPGEEWVLIAAIDDATSKIAAAEFYESETTLNCMDILEQVIKVYGVPWGVYVDRAGWLGGSKRANFGDFREACDILGIELIFANSPQAKGRIERWFQVPQDRLVAELRTLGITDMEKANEYLKNEFIGEYWNKTKTIKAKSSEVKYRPAPDKNVLREALCQRAHRKINYDNTFKWKTNYYQILNPPGNITNQRVELRFYKDGESAVFFANRKLDVKLFEETIRKKAN